MTHLIVLPIFSRKRRQTRRQQAAKDMAKRRKKGDGTVLIKKQN